MITKPKTPPISYGDSCSVGQLARHWDKPNAFIDSLTASGKLVVNERSLVTNAALRDFYCNHGTELD